MSPLILKTIEPDDNTKATFDRNAEVCALVVSDEDHGLRQIVILSRLQLAALAGYLTGAFDDID
jgi:hypothetical protein